MHEEEVKAGRVPAPAGAREEERRGPEKLFDFVVELSLSPRGVDLPERGEAADLGGAAGLGRACCVEAGAEERGGVVGHDGVHDVRVVRLAEDGQERMSFGRLAVGRIGGRVGQRLQSLRGVQVKEFGTEG